MDAERVLNGCFCYPEHPFITSYILPFTSYLLYLPPFFQRHTHFVPYIIAQASICRRSPFTRLPQCLIILRLPYSPPLRIMQYRLTLRDIIPKTLACRMSGFLFLRFLIQLRLYLDTPPPLHRCPVYAAHNVCYPHARSHHLKVLSI